ncbi:hypothetical protein ACFWHR_04075 [Leucobacter sp. NPDC058333]|uniref:hypothetical protein n=1 Tax=Leucobacter sp. NPDC058333 TaxID=3346450 RepID=UPI00365D4095
MDTIIYLGAAALTVLAATNAVLMRISARNKRQAREDRAEAASLLSEARGLVDGLVGSSLRMVVTSIEVDPETRRTLLAALRNAGRDLLACDCPNCSEDRRIAQARQNRNEL